MELSYPKFEKKLLRNGSSNTIQDLFLSFNKEFKFKFCVKQHFAKSQDYCRNPESLAQVMSCVENVVASVSRKMVCSSVRNLSRRAELSVFRKSKDISRTF
jgi:hypothetical protein